jgi:hypothetical protein
MKKSVINFLIVTLLPLPLITMFGINAVAQTATLKSTPTETSTQNIAAALAALPEADTLIYINPRRILTVAAPKVIAPADLANMRTVFDDLKKGVGVDPSTLDYVVIAMRFHKPAADLSFAPPEIITVASGDFSADSVMTVARLAMQEKARDEKHGTRTLAITKIDPIAEMADKNPLLKSFAEIGFGPLNTNTLVIGNISYVKAAMDAADGTGRIANNAIASLVRDPDALLSAAGSPLTAFAKSFGLLGTQATPRDPRCETGFGNFYAAITMDGGNFNFRGAMNADNPDTAKIINNLLSSLLQQAITSVPDKSAQNVLNGLKLAAAENEVVMSASVPETVIADLIREQSKPKVSAASEARPPAKKRVTRKRTRPTKRT